MARQAGLKLVHVPYKGSGPAINDLLGSQVESMMDQLTASIDHIRGGRIKALGVTSLKRSPLLPNVATLDEQGLTGFEAGTFTGLFAPAGTPPAVLDKLHAALEKALANETVRTRFRTMGVEVMHMSRPEYMGRARGAEGVNAPGFGVIRRLLTERDDCWTKISSWYRLSDSGQSDNADMKPFVQTLLADRPDRCVWGTNWPHPGLTEFMPNDADLLDQLESWLPSDAVREPLFASNAAKLYRFED